MSCEEIHENSHHSVQQGCRSSPICIFCGLCCAESFSKRQRTIFFHSTDLLEVVRKGAKSLFFFFFFFDRQLPFRDNMQSSRVVQIPSPSPQLRMWMRRTSSHKIRPKEKKKRNLLWRLAGSCCWLLDNVKLIGLLNSCSWLYWY